jgi:antitoxin component of MazEF toxin-antitoxin module
MVVSLVTIGKSHGIQIPKATLDEAGLRDTAEMIVENGSIVIKPLQTVNKPREGWKEAFLAAGESERLLDLDSTDGDEHWEWNETI